MIGKNPPLEEVSRPLTGLIEHRVPRGDHHLYVREYPGSGSPFVLLHGFPDNMRIYDQLIPILVNAGRRVVAFDFLGFGASDKPAGYDCSFEAQRGDLAAVVDYLKLEQIVPVAHDAGGVAAIDFAIANRDSISGLCLLNTFYGNTPTLRMPELIGLFAVPELHALAIAMATDPGQMAFLLGFQQSQFKMNVSRAQREIIDEVVRPIITDNFTQQPGAGPAFVALATKVLSQIKLNSENPSKLESLSIPSTIIWGETDAYLNTGVAEDFAARLKGASLHVLDAGHWPQLDLPEEVARYILTEL
jgi:haloalkane dehalogenase